MNPNTRLRGDLSKEDFPRYVKVGAQENLRSEGWNRYVSKARAPNENEEPRLLVSKRCCTPRRGYSFFAPP